MLRALGIVSIAVAVSACSFDSSASIPPDAAIDAQPSRADADLECGSGVTPIPIIVDESFVGTTTDGTLLDSELCMQTNPSAGPEKVHVIVFDQVGNYRATTKLPGTMYDSIVYARTDCDDPATTLPCDDNFSMSEDAVEITVTEPGEMYFVIVDTHQGQGGGVYELKVLRL